MKTNDQFHRGLTVSAKSRSILLNIAKLMKELEQTATLIDSFISLNWISNFLCWEISKKNKKLNKKQISTK